jgi:diaminopimelate epimerase
MAPMVFTKMAGAGNDFLIFDNLQGELEPGVDRATLARRICHRHLGVGADGLVILEASPNYDFRWDFYNADGSAAEMCGNAARCAVRWWALAGHGAAQVRFETRAGVIAGGLGTAGLVHVAMPKPGPALWGQHETIDGAKVLFDVVNTGVPHAVVEIAGEVDLATLKPMARALRSHSRFLPQGSNVTLISWLSPQRLRAQSFERGVEDFTLACGTGAVAAAMVAFHQHPELLSVDVQMPGGLLTVGNEPEPRLTGPAERIAKVHWFG